MSKFLESNHFPYLWPGNSFGSKGAFLFTCFHVFRPVFFLTKIFPWKMNSYLEQTRICQLEPSGNCRNSCGCSSRSSNSRSSRSSSRAAAPWPNSGQVLWGFKVPSTSASRLLSILLSTISISWVTNKKGCHSVSQDGATLWFPPGPTLRSAIF